MTLPSAAFAKAGAILLSFRNPGQQKPAVATLKVEPPTPVILEITDSASYRLPVTGEDPKLACGAIITIFGANLGPARGVAPKPDSQRILPLKAGEVEVEIDKVKVPVLYAHENQISAMLTYSTPPGLHSVEVVNWGKRSLPMQVEVVQTNPALFTLDASGSGLVAATNYPGSGRNELHSVSKPAKPGSYMSLYGTGFGPIPDLDEARLVPRGVLRTALPVEACVGTSPCEPADAAAAPDYYGGLVQINIRVPDQLPAGWHPIVLRVNGTESQSNTFVVVGP